MSASPTSKIFPLASGSQQGVLACLELNWGIILKSTVILFPLFLHEIYKFIILCISVRCTALAIVSLYFQVNITNSILSGLHSYDNRKFPAKFQPPLRGGTGRDKSKRDFEPFPIGNVWKTAKNRLLLI